MTGSGNKETELFVFIARVKLLADSSSFSNPKTDPNLLSPLSYYTEELCCKIEVTGFYKNLAFSVAFTGNVKLRDL